MLENIAQNLSASPEIAFYILAVIVVFLIIWIIVLERRVSRLLAGKNASSLEDAITGNRRDLESLKAFQQECIDYLKQLDSRVRTSIRGTETIRFNPFKGTGSGGNQSFASSFVNEKGDGVIISSLYSHDRMSVYAKPLKKFTSEFQLSDEEKKAIELSREALNPNK